MFSFELLQRNEGNGDIPYGIIAGFLGDGTQSEPEFTAAIDSILADLDVDPDVFWVDSDIRLTMPTMGVRMGSS